MPKRKRENEDSNLWGGWTALSSWAIYLLKYGIDVAARDKYSNTPLHSAASLGDLGGVQYLVKQGADIFACNAYGQTPLQTATGAGHLSIVQWLAEQRPEAEEVWDRFGNTPLHTAAFRGHLAVLEFLIARGANVMVRRRVGGETPLHIASSRGHLAVVQSLIRSGADIAMCDQCGETPLHAAVCGGRLETVQYLVEQGADIHLLNEDEDSPIILAFERGHHRIVQYLQQRGAVLPAHLVAEGEANNINQNQSVHAVTVHVGVAQAAAALKARYEKSDIEQAITALQGYVEALPSASVPDAKDPYSTAKRCLPRLLRIKFEESRSEITLREAIAFVWIGLHDPVEKARRQAERGLTQAEQQLSFDEQKALWEKREEELLQEVIPQWLYEIQRGYNLSKAGIDNGAPDRVTCASGSFNKTIYALNRRHSLVNIDYVTEKTINAKAVTLANEIFDKLPTEDRQRYAQESRQEMSPGLVALFRRELSPLLHAEFDSFKADGLNVDKAIEDVLSAVEYLSIKKLATMVEKLEEEEEPAPEPILRAYSSLSANLPSSSRDVNEEVSQSTMNRL